MDTLKKFNSRLNKRLTIWIGHHQMLCNMDVFLGIVESLLIAFVLWAYDDNLVFAVC